MYATNVCGNVRSQLKWINEVWFGWEGYVLFSRKVELGSQVGRKEHQEGRSGRSLLCAKIRNYVIL